MLGTKDTLYLLVTCCLEASRVKVLEKVIDNFFEQADSFDFFSDLIIFDNASICVDPLTRFPSEVNIIRANKNIGYWSAIDWVLNNYHIIKGRDYRFIYLIESDLIHYDMERLVDCENFLLRNERIGAVRTQKFSVEKKHLFDKNKPRINSFRKSWVAQYNAITNESAWFQLADPVARIYLTNFHTKLPALNRMIAMQEIFRFLSQLSNGFTEFEFMKAYYERYPTISLLDEGIFHQDLSFDKNIVTGSYSSEKVLEMVGYHSTRVARIIKDGFEVQDLLNRKM